MKRILIIGAAGMGNIIMFMPTLKALREKFPSAYIVFLVFFQSCKEIIEKCPLINEVLFISHKSNLFKIIKFIFRLSKYKFDISIITFPAPRFQFNLISFFSCAKIRIAHKLWNRNFTTLNFLNNKRVKIKKVHDIKQNIYLLSPLGIKDSFNKKLEVWIDEDDKAFANEFFNKLDIKENDFLIGIHPGATKTQKYKWWGEEKFASLCDNLIEKYSAKIIIFEGPDENGIIDKIVKNMKYNKIIGVKNEKLSHVCALISKCKLFISNDSGLMHIAEAFGIKTIGIYGPSDPLRTAPYMDMRNIVKLNLPCSPCDRTFSTLGKKHHCRQKENICMKNLQVSYVIKKVEESF